MWHQSVVRFPEIEAWTSPSLMTSHQHFHDLISSWICVDPCQQKDTNFCCLLLIFVYPDVPTCTAAPLGGRCILCPFSPKWESPAESSSLNWEGASGANCESDESRGEIQAGTKPLQHITWPKTIRLEWQMIHLECEC